MSLRYKLRCTVTGHEKDVRAVCPAFFPENAFLSGSRDVTARCWVPNESDIGFSEGHVMSGHSNYVFCVAMMPPDETYPQGLIVTGSSDKKILAFTLDSPQPVFSLEEHADTVCTLTAGKFGSLLSGSWDTTAKVWLKQKCVMTLKGHEAAVWSVALLPEVGLMLTASADKTIRMWKAGKCQHIFKGHDDCVRGLAVLSSSEFLSCANDATIRRWNITGECTHTFYGHTNYIYSIAVLPNGKDFVTCGEDRSLRVWRDGACDQILMLPALSIWTVSVLPNGDVVTGSSDGIIRVFTTNEERAADEDCQKAFEEDVASSSIPAQIGDIKTEDLVGPSALLSEGKRDGQTMMIKDGGKIQAHQWNAAENRWIKVGDVVGGSGGSTITSGKQLYEGKEYDYVFDVELTEGHPALKLPYNLSEDPWMAANRFLEKNELDKLFLDQVAIFIQDQTKDITLGDAAPPSVSDPFTGGGRYIPGSSTGVSGSGAADPFTGAGRYVPGSGQPAQPAVTPQVPSFTHGADPFTGASSHRPGGNNPVNTYFPMNNYLRFDVANIARIIGKVREFNKTIGDELSVDDNNIALLDQLAATGEVKPGALETLSKLLSWPTDKLFPGLDILRLCVRFAAPSSHYFSPSSPDTLNFLLRCLSPDSSAPNKMLALRTIVNCFQNSAGESAVLSHHDALMAHLLNLKTTNPNANIQIAFTSVLLNLSVLYRKNDNEDGRVACLSAIAELRSEVTDSEAQFRSLVCLGNILSGSSVCQEFAKSLGLLEFLTQFASVQDSQKVQSCASFIVGILR